MTIWHEETRNMLPQLVKDGLMRHAIAGKEICPDTGRLHWQCFGQWYVAVRKSQVKKQLQDDGVHLEPAWGEYDNGKLDGSDNLSYCCKDGDFEMWGEPAFYRQGQRNDLHAAKEAILENPWCDEQAHMKTHFEAHVKGGRVLTKLRALTQQKEAKHLDNEKASVLVFWGPAGTGKSRKAMDYLRNLYKDSVFRLDPPTNDKARQWWDGYHGQQGVVIDDFEPSAIGFRSFLILTDPYNSKRFEVKGSYVFAKPKMIIITCDRHPKDWVWEGQEATCADQLKRRFDAVTYFPPTAVSTEAAVWHDTDAATFEEDITRDGIIRFEANKWEASSSSSSSALSRVVEFAKSDVMIRSTDKDVIVVDD